MDKDFDPSRRDFLRGRPAPARPRRASAAIGDACLARRGVHCQSCGDQCEARAIRFALTLGGPPQPWIDAESCTGCGACVAVCPGGAVTLGAAHG